jgi:hypothetical protein
MEKVIRLATRLLLASECEQTIAEVRHQWPQVVFRNETLIARAQVNDAHALRPLCDAWQARVIAARKDIHGDAELGQVAADFIHVHVLTTGVLAAQERQWTGVLTQKRDSQLMHGACLLTWRSYAVASDRWLSRAPVTSANAAFQSAINRSRPKRS